MSPSQLLFKTNRVVEVSLRCLCLLLAMVFAAPASAGAGAEPVDATLEQHSQQMQYPALVPTKPDYLSLNVLVTSLGEFNQAAQSFRIGFYVWMLADESQRTYFQNLRLIGAQNVLRDEDLSFVRADGTTVLRRFIEAKVHHVWSLADFPYDEQTLLVRMNLLDADYDRVRFASTSINSITDGELQVDGWRLTGGSLYATRKVYSSDLGHETQVPGELSVPELEISLSLERVSTSGFWKLVAAAFAAAGLALGTFFIPLNLASALSPRFGLIAGSVFADVVSMRQASGSLGAGEILTLTDKVHIAVLIYIAIAAITALFTHWHYQTFENRLRIIQIDQRVALVSTLMLALTILLLLENVW